MQIEPTNFIGSYRILSKFAESHSSSTYVAEHFSTSMTVLVTLWHGITFTTSDDAQAFLRKARHGVIFRNSQQIPLLDAQLYHQSPYIVTPFNEPMSIALNNHTQFIDHVIANRKTLHPDNPHASVEAFIYIFCTSSNTTPFISTNTTTNEYNTIAPYIQQFAQRLSHWSSSATHHILSESRFPQIKRVTLLPIAPHIQQFAQRLSHWSSSATHHILSESRLPPLKRITLLPGENPGKSVTPSPKVSTDTGHDAPTFPLTEGVPLKTRLQLWSRRPYIVASIVLLLVLLIGGTAFFNFLPANTATITITPLSKRITHTYPISLVTGVPGANQVKEHLISYTTPPQSETVLTTGIGHRAATTAQGQVEISQIHFSNPGANNTSVSTGDIQANDGTTITINPFTATEGGSVTVNASATSAGQSGNIPAQDINHPYPIYQQGQSNTQSTTIGVAYIQNTSPFTGGQDASDYTYVRQQDIDGAANPLITQLTPTAQQEAQQQLQPGEQLVKDLTCNNDVNSDYQAQEITTYVTVTVQTMCNGIAYNKQDLATAAANAQKADAIAQYGTGYQLAGDITTGTPNLSPSSPNGSIVYEVPTDGIWVFQIDKAQQQELARTIAGHRPQDATNQLLKHKGIKRALITITSSISNLLPTSPDNIKFTIVHIPGLTSS